MKLRRNIMINGNILLIDPENDLLVAHNLSFDKARLVEEGLTCLKGIKTLDTLSLVKMLIPKRYGNDKLRTVFYGYECHNSMDYKGDSHSADYDCMMMREVMLKLFEEFDLDIDSAYAMVSDFGKFNKYKGVKWEEVVKSDPDYCKWILNTFTEDSKNKKLLDYLKECRL